MLPFTRFYFPPVPSRHVSGRGPIELGPTAPYRGPGVTACCLRRALSPGKHLEHGAHKGAGTASDAHAQMPGPRALQALPIAGKAHQPSGERLSGRLPAPRKALVCSPANLLRSGTVHLPTGVWGDGSCEPKGPNIEYSRPSRLAGLQSIPWAQLTASVERPSVS